MKWLTFIFQHQPRTSSKKYDYLNCLFSFCAKNATTTFSSSCEMMNLWRRGRRLIKHFLSFQFPLVRANVAWNLLFFFLKNYAWIKEMSEIAMCIFENGWAWREWCTRHLPIAYFWRHWRALIIESSRLSYFSCWLDGHNSIPIFELFLGFRSPKIWRLSFRGKNLFKNSCRVIFGLPKSLSYLLLSLTKLFVLKNNAWLSRC